MRQNSGRETGRISPQIIFEDSNLLVLDKPSHLVVLPTSHYPDLEKTLAGFVFEHLGISIKNIGKENRFGFVHRLDRDTSGVILVAKTSEFWDFLTKQFEPEFKFPEQDYFSFKSFLKKMPETNFGKFSMYQSFLNFAVMIASPFFAVYMIRNLNFSYPQYTLITVTASIFSLIGMRVWGKYADKHGNVKTLKILGIFIAIVPLLWIFNSNIYYLLFVQVISGFAWGGFNLSVSDFIYDATTKEKRALFISYHNVLNGIASFLGAALGGILVAIKMPFTPIILLFVLSGILRIIFYYIFIHKIEEPRNIKEVHHTHRLINLAPSQGLLHELIAIVSKRKNNKQ